MLLSRGFFSSFFACFLTFQSPVLMDRSLWHGSFCSDVGPLYSFFNPQLNAANKPIDGPQVHQLNPATPSICLRLCVGFRCFITGYFSHIFDLQMDFQTWPSGHRDWNFILASL